MGSKVFRRWHLCCAAALASASCTNSQVVRFAPPGIIKYENLAGDQPANADIQARVAERGDVEAARFPVLSEEPSVRPEKPSADVAQARTVDLEAARSDLEKALAQDWAAARSERDATNELAEKRRALDEAITNANAAAANERRAAPPQPDDIQDSEK